MSDNIDISDDLLFPVPESLSPRLLWMKRHGIITFHHRPPHYFATWFAGLQSWWPSLTGAEFFAEETAHNGDSRACEGDTEEEALANLATRAGLPLWNEEGAA